MLVLGMLPLWLGAQGTLAAWLPLFLAVGPVADDRLEAEGGDFRHVRGPDLGRNRQGVAERGDVHGPSFQPPKDQRTFSGILR